MAEPTLAEDVLLVLFQPDVGLRSGAGVIAGEGTLFYPLAGALLVELAMAGSVRVPEGRGATTVERGDGPVPDDPILHRMWERTVAKPVGVQALLAEIGPHLRGPLIDRLVERGDLRRERRRALGIFEATELYLGSTARRAELVAQVRAVLVDGVDPSPRMGALAALLWASGTLPQFHMEIPWTSEVIDRARSLERGAWGAAAAAEAVTRTITATITANIVIATTVLPGR